jgi:hypothetical protein
LVVWRAGIPESDNNGSVGGDTGSSAICATARKIAQKLQASFDGPSISFKNPERAWGNADDHQSVG